MRTLRKHYGQYDEFDENAYEFSAHREPYSSSPSRTSYKKRWLSLDEEDDNNCNRDFDIREKRGKHDSKRAHHHKTFVRQACNEVFKCRQCRRFIGPPPCGGRQRNHCPFCLYSLHVDGKTPGDRMSTCGSRMEPIGSFQRAKGEYVLVHRCLGCGIERFNRIAADDNFEFVLALPVLITHGNQ